MTQADYVATYGSLAPSSFGPNLPPVETWNSSAVVRGQAMKHLYDILQTNKSREYALGREYFWTHLQGEDVSTPDGNGVVFVPGPANPLGPEMWIWVQVIKDYVDRGGKFAGDAGFQTPVGEQSAQTLIGKDVFAMTGGGTIGQPSALQTAVATVVSNTQNPLVTTTTTPAVTTVVQDLVNRIFQSIGGTAPFPDATVTDTLVVDAQTYLDKLKAVPMWAWGAAGIAAYLFFFRGKRR